jgi:serine/threonine protein kinase
LSALQQQIQATLGDAYRLEDELGGGGMSRVFVAHETALGRKVVIKVLLPELAASVSVDRFRREIQLAAQLQHPHIVPLLSAGESEGLPYFIMPFVAGESLRARVGRTGELPIAESIRILRDVVSALAYAHAFGVVHRDIKPDNVLISGGVAVVTDFGVAKAVSASSGGVHSVALTTLGLALGTPAYMAPEQASGDGRTDHRADIYALGVMAYEMLTARVPFAGRSTQATLAAHVLEMPDPIDRLRPVIPPALSALVMSCLAKRPADRPQAASDVLNALDAIATPGTGSVPTTVVSIPAIAPLRPRPRPSRLVAFSVGAALVGVAALLLMLQRPRTPATESAGSASRPPDSVGLAAKPAPPGVAIPTRTQVETVFAPKKSAQARPAQEHRPESPPRRAAPVAPVREPQADSAGPTLGAPVQEAAPAPVQQAPAPPAPANAPESTAISPSVAPLPAPPTAAAPAAPAPPIPAPAPTQPSRDPQQDFREAVDLIGEYSKAVESESVGNLRRVYPGMTGEQQNGWEQFFRTVHDIKSQLEIRKIDLAGDIGSVLVGGTYTYVNGSTHRSEEQQVSFSATLRRTAGAWRIAEIR